MNIEVSLGFACADGECPSGATGLFAAADADLYRDKVLRKSLGPSAHTP
jgi:hypothetical protein